MAGKYLFDADLRGVDGTETCFDEAMLEGARFDGATLREASFLHAHVAHAKFRDCDLTDAVFAHERAHLRLRHHRYLLAAELSRSVLPFIRPLTRQLHHATERAADEAAVDAVAGERSIVATAIARAALGTPAIGTIPALGGGSVPRRLEALLWPEREARAGAMTSMVAACGGLVIVGAMLAYGGSIAAGLAVGPWRQVPRETARAMG